MHCFLDYRVSFEELNNLLHLKLNPIILPITSLVYEAINGHVDIQLNVIDKNKVIVHKSISDDFLKLLFENKIEYILSDKELSSKYPSDIILNGLILDDYFVHNLKFTDKNLLKSQENKKLINVNQGYTKCSTLPLSGNACITSDKGIFNALKNQGIDMLLVPPGDILLPSLNYGFIGGVGGMIDENTLALFGDLDSYKYGNDVKTFLKAHNIEYISLKKGKLIDRGSLLVI